MVAYELLNTKFKSQFKQGFTKLVVTSWSLTRVIVRRVSAVFDVLVK